MRLVGDQLLLVAAGAALGAAGWRLAARAVASGLLRLIGAVVLAAGAAVLSALVLALVALGASPLALTAVAVVVWAGVWRTVPATGPTATAQLTEWWGGLPPWGRVARVALTGAGAGFMVWILRHPGLGLDALTYHLALPVAWAHNGEPGSLVVVNDGLQIQNYPLTWEVLVAWGTGIGHTLIPAMLMTPASLVLLGAAVRAGLREVGVSWRLAWLAAGAVVTLPIIVIQLPGPNNDLPEVAWLACVGAMVAGAAGPRGRVGEAPRGVPAEELAGEPTAAAASPRRPTLHPGLLPIALIATGLCVGTKTTGAPLAAFALVLGGWACRGDLRRLVRPLVLAVVAAAFIGIVWYVRNLLDHGAPFWPLSTTPWGDPIPAAFRAVDASLLSNFHATLHARTDAYWRILAGGVVLVAGALVSVLWATRWAVRWGAVVVAATLLIWAASPYTGISTTTQLAIGATRYLLPCLLAATAALALAARRTTERVRVTVAELLSGAVLLGAIAVNLYRDQALGYPNAPGARLLLLSAAVGAGVALAAEALGRAGRLRAVLARWGARTFAAAATIAVLVTLLVPVDGFMTAHAGTGLFDAGLVRWLHSRPAYRHGDAPIYVGPVTVAVLTGARLAHPLITLPGDVACATLEREASRGWVAVEIDPSALTYARRWIECLREERPVYFDSTFVVYAPEGLARPG